MIMTYNTAPAPLTQNMTKRFLVTLRLLRWLISATCITIDQLWPWPTQAFPPKPIADHETRNIHRQGYTTDHQHDHRNTVRSFPIPLSVTNTMTFLIKASNVARGWK